MRCRILGLVDTLPDSDRLSPLVRKFSLFNLQFDFFNQGRRKKHLHTFVSTSCAVGAVIEKVKLTIVNLKL